MFYWFVSIDEDVNAENITQNVLLPNCNGIYTGSEKLKYIDLNRVEKLKQNSLLSFMTKPALLFIEERVVGETFER